MSFDRPNLKYEVLEKSKEPLKQLGRLLLDRFKNLCGIVYCLSKSECAEVSKYLNEKCKVKTVYYHAGLATRQRIAVQKKWHTGEVNVVCATIAFGMGIDKPDVVSPVLQFFLFFCFLVSASNFDGLFYFINVYCGKRQPIGKLSIQIVYCNFSVGN